MDIKELSKYYYLKQEINDLELKIKELKETGGISGIRYREVDIQQSKINVTIQDKLLELEDKLMERRVSALEEYLKIQNYIQQIEEPELRQIFTYRFMDLMNWEEIGEKMNYHRTSVSKKVQEYLKHSHNSHE